MKANPVFRDYAAAIAMTKRIFEMDSVGYAQNRATIKNDDRLIYHLTVEKQALDYLCDIKAFLNTPVGGRYAVVDAKYKMLYDEGRIDRDDARQLSGYARFAPVHGKLHDWGIPEAASASLLPCLIIPTLDGRIRDQVRLFPHCRQREMAWVFNPCDSTARSSRARFRHI